MMRTLIFLCFLIAVACVDRRQAEYQFVAALDTDDLKPLASIAEVGLSKMGEGLFKVRSLLPESGSQIKVLDGFLYERDIQIAHFVADLELLRDYEPPTLANVKEAIGEEGWSMTRSRRDYELSVIFGKDWSAKRPKLNTEAAQELGAATAALFGELGQSSAQGTTTVKGDNGQSWRVIVRMNFTGRKPLLLEVTPSDSEGARYWASAEGLGVFLWRRDISKFSSKPYEGAGEPGGKSGQAKENFEALAADDSPGSPGSRFRIARGKYDHGMGDKQIAAGRIWTSRITAVFDRGESGSVLHHVGGFWKIDFPRGDGARR